MGAEGVLKRAANDNGHLSCYLLPAQEVADLVTFVRDGLLDPRARAERLCKLVPASLPSGRTLAAFADCQ
jgi:hypothetical protein